MNIDKGTTDPVAAAEAIFEQTQAEVEAEELRNEHTARFLVRSFPPLTMEEAREAIHLNDVYFTNMANRNGMSPRDFAKVCPMTYKLLALGMNVGIVRTRKQTDGPENPSA